MQASSHALRVRSAAIPLHAGQPALEPVRLSGREGLNHLFEYELLLKTPDALNLGASGATDFDLDAFIGRELSCLIELDGAGEFLPGAAGASVDRIGAGTREINALITEAALWGEEGRHVQYRLVLRPWLHLASLSTDCRIFQNKTVVEILDELLGDYPFKTERSHVDDGKGFNEKPRLCVALDYLHVMSGIEGKGGLGKDGAIEVPLLFKVLPTLMGPGKGDQLEVVLSEQMKKLECIAGVTLWVSKPNIRSSRNYKYLLDPGLRTKETGDAPLVIEGYEISGAKFQYLTWRNVKFLNCDFAGNYDLELTALENSIFENCRILGIHGFGERMRNVRFYRCTSGFNALWVGGPDCKDVLFEECEHVAENSPDPNHQGRFGTHGEATFINCKAKSCEVLGKSKVVMRGCAFEGVSYQPSGDSAIVQIENCKLRGTFDMVPASLQSLTIRDTQIDLLDLTGASVMGDVVMERVKGATIKAGILARNLTLKDSQIFGPAEPGKPVFDINLRGSENFLIDNVQFASGLQDQVGLGAGRPLEANEWSVVPRNKRAVIRNSKLPRVDASWLETQHLQLQGNEIGSLDLSNSRIGQLEVSGNIISRGVDFSHTQAKQANVQRLRSDQAKLEGSNIKPAR